MPGHLADSHAGGIGVHHDLVGFDPRGVGYSADLPCPGDTSEPDPSLPEKEQARQTAERAAAANRECVDANPAFVRNLTTPTIARDLDRIREALGEDKIGYYGVSWGTALGAQYRTLFDAHVDKMLLDSVMPPDLNVTAMDDGQATAGENTFHDFASWIARYDASTTSGPRSPTSRGPARPADRTHTTPTRRRRRRDRQRHARQPSPRLGRSGQAAGRHPRRRCPGNEPRAEAEPWLGRRAARVQPLPADGAALQRVAEPRDFETVWQHRLDRQKRLPVAGGYGFYEQLCVGWPLPAGRGRSPRGPARCSSSATPTSRSRRSAGPSRCGDGSVAR